MKKSVKMLLLCALLIALAGSYVLVNRMNERAEIAEESGSFALVEQEADALTGLRWTNEDAEYHFIKEDGAWKDANDADFPTNQSAVDDLANRFLTMEANRKLTDVEDAAEYGIGEDSFAVTAEWSDGSETVYTMGDETPFADGWYLQCSDDAGVVYASSSALDSVFADTSVDLAELEEIPRVENANRLVIGATLDATRSEDDDRFDPDQKWYDTATGEPMDDEGIENVLSAISAVEWQELLRVSATEEELSEWQLDDASATVFTEHGEDGQVCTLLLGGTDADGNRYARLPDSGMVYTISAETADSLLAATGDNLRSAELFTIDYENLKEFTAVLDGQELRFEVPAEAATKTDEETEEEAPVDEDAILTGETNEAADSAAGENEAAATEEETTDETEALWNRIAALTSNGQTVEAPSGDPLLDLYVSSASGAILECEFYYHDVDTYIAVLSDGRTLLVPAADVDALIRALRQ